MYDPREIERDYNCQIFDGTRIAKLCGAEENVQREYLKRLASVKFRIAKWLPAILHEKDHEPRYEYNLCQCNLNSALTRADALITYIEHCFSFVDDYYNKTKYAAVVVEDMEKWEEELLYYYFDSSKRTVLRFRTLEDFHDYAWNTEHRPRACVITKHEEKRKNIKKVKAKYEEIRLKLRDCAKSGSIVCFYPLHSEYDWKRYHYHGNIEDVLKEAFSSLPFNFEDLMSMEDLANEQEKLLKRLLEMKEDPKFGIAESFLAEIIESLERIPYFSTKEYPQLR